MILEGEGRAKAGRIGRAAGRAGRYVLGGQGNRGAAREQKDAQQPQTQTPRRAHRPPRSGPERDTDDRGVTNNNGNNSDFI